MVCSEGAKLLIDAGLAARDLEERLRKIAIAPHQLCGILISHEHSDHVRSAGVLARRYHLPLYINSATYNACSQKLGKVSRVEMFTPNQRFQLGDLTIDTFSVLHDAADPVGFCLFSENRKLGIATDLGKPTTLVRQMLKESHALILESNHDPEMLLSGPYPWWLKQRIRSDFGHLSNEDTQSLLRELMHQDLKNIILAHVSEHNNHSSLVHQTAMQVLQEREDVMATLYIASQHQSGEMIEV